MIEKVKNRKKLRFDLRKKLIAGYAAVIILFLATTVFSSFVLRKSRSLDQTVTDVYLPLLQQMEKLNNLIRNADNYTYSWIYLPNEDQKARLRKLHEEDFPRLQQEVLAIRKQIGNEKELDSLVQIIQAFDESIAPQKTIMSALNSFEDYDDDELLFFTVIPIYDDQVKPVLLGLEQALERNIAAIQQTTNEKVLEKYGAFDQVELFNRLLTILAVVIGILSAYYSIRSTVKPIKWINQLILKMSNGELPDTSIKQANDEIGDMAKSLTKLRDALHHKALFALEVGEGNLDQPFEILSENDVLGKALLNMRDNLRQVIDETNRVVKTAGSQGDLMSRVEEGGMTGAWYELSHSVNDLLDSIAQPVLRVNDIINALANGDLTQRYTSEANGDIKSLTSSLNQAMDNLNSLIIQISQSAETVETSSEEMLVSGEEMSLNTQEIASSIAQMTNGAHRQVTKVDQNSSEIESILQSSVETGDKSSNIDTAARKGVTNSEKGNQIVSKVAERIQEISHFSEQTNASMQVLTDRSQEISRVLGVITEIARQTNLLSLNAAIEAAQAGDAGRGFGVVAEEIRKLAENSRRSAQEIKKLIEDVQNDTSETARMIGLMASTVKESVSASAEASEVFLEISATSEQTLRSSEEILQASKLQTESIQKVVNTTEEVVVIAEQTATGSEEIAASASELSAGMRTYIEKTQHLSKIAVDLKESVNRFKLQVAPVLSPQD